MYQKESSYVRPGCYIPRHILNQVAVEGEKWHPSEKIEI